MKCNFALNEGRTMTHPFPEHVFQFFASKKWKPVSGRRNLHRMTTRNINNLRDYLPTPFNAFLQIDNHPALPITLSAATWSQQPLVQTHGKEFRSVEHLFHHYNKYNAGSALNHQLYLKDDCQRLLQYIIFQEGPYTKMSAAQTLELSPAEWADMPALEEIPTRSAPAQNTVRYDNLAPAPQVNPQDEERITRKKRITNLHSRCDAIERNLRELNKKNTETNAETNTQIDKICLAIDNINATISTLFNVIKTIHSINAIKTRLA